MKLISVSSNQIQLVASREDLLVLNAALNEICNGIDLFEFETRVGASRERVASLLAEIKVILDSAS